MNLENDIIELIKRKRINNTYNKVQKFTLPDNHISIKLSELVEILKINNITI